MKVLSFDRTTNANGFLPYTEKTLHTQHGKMYKVTTATGHSITVTDDHSLATIGDDDLFKPLPPVYALGACVPIVLFVDYEGQVDRPDLLGRDYFAIDDSLIDANIVDLRQYLTSELSRCDWVYAPNDEHEKQLLCFLLARAGIYHELSGRFILCWPEFPGYVPEDGVLIERQQASFTNTYRLLPYTWSTVTEVREVEREDTTYDFTVPDFPLFVGNMILVYDTMQVHVPVTEAARQEALDKMLPSKNLFSVRTGEPMMLPQQEAIFGLYKASQPSSEKRISVADLEKVRDDLEYGKMKPNQPVAYKGHDTTAGIALANELLPDKYRNYTGVWNKKLVAGILLAIGKEQPALYTKVADGFKDLGFNFSYQMGASFKATDFHLADLKANRNAMYKEVDKKLVAIEASKLSDADKYKQKVDVLREAQAYNQKLTGDATANAFHQWAYSGSKGSESQVMQIIASPTIVADPRDRVIPVPIRRSYLEGLTPAEYWVSSYGTRKGTVSAKLSVAPGGMMAKEIIGNVLDIVVTMRDCGTKEGVIMPIADHKNILERYEAGTNKLIDATYLEQLEAEGRENVTVRSPVKCKAKHGVCQLCFGHNEKGQLPEIGENVGVQAAQAITEPLTQMGLSSKHTAGTAAEDRVGLSTIQRFYTMPNQYSGAALIAANTGIVTRMEPAPAGGTDLYVDNKKHHVVPGRAIYVKVGDKVAAGDILTNGVPNLSKIVPHKGIDFSRQLFVHHADDLYRRAGAGALKKNFEVVARGLINYVEITDPGDFDMVAGDIVDYNNLQSEIQEHPEKTPPTFKPIQRGTTYAPQDKPDWLANFAFKYLKKNIVENAATGAKSEIHSYHPIAGYVTATQFGKGQGGRY